MRYILYLMLYIGSMHAQVLDSSKLNAFFNEMESGNKAMGSIAISENGTIVYSNSFGYANLDANSKNNEETIHRIGSITKTFTAVVIMQLIEEKKLTLGTSLSSYFSKMPNAAKISIEDLLRHQSGLYNITNDENIQSWVVNPQSREQMLTRFEKNGVVFEPGEKKEYSNTNFILLSYIAEKIEKKPYSEILKERIIEPLSLKRTKFGERINPSNNEALSYYNDDESDKWNLIDMQSHMSGPMGAGAVVSTPSDLVRFYDAVFSGKLVSNESLEQMTTMKMNMGMGVSQLIYRGFEVYGHDGGIDGFQSFALHIPKKKVSVAFSLNGANTATIALLMGALDAYFADDADMQSESTIKLTSSDLDIYLGIYSGDTFPAKVTFTKRGDVLIAQATGQPEFELIAVANDSFRYDAMGVTFDFKIDANTMILGLGGDNHILNKE